MEGNAGGQLGGSTKLSDAKKRRLAVLDSKLSRSHKKRKATLTQQSEGSQYEALPQTKRNLEISARGKGSGRARLPPRHVQKEEPRQEFLGSSAPPYDELSSDINRGRLLIAKKPAAGEKDICYVDSLLEDVAATNPRLASAKAASGLRVQDKMLLLDNPAAPAKKFTPRRHGSQVAMLSGVKLRKLGLHALRPEEIRYEKLQNLHQMWERYARDAVRSAATPEGAALQLDLHGCLLAVKHHRNPQLIGQEGIVVRYSNQVFHIVTQKDRLLMMPRLEDSRFQFNLDQLHIVLYK